MNPHQAETVVLGRLMEIVDDAGKPGLLDMATELADFLAGDHEAMSNFTTLVACRHLIHFEEE